MLFHSNSCYANAPQCYVIRTLPGLFLFRGRAYSDVKTQSSADCGYIDRLESNIAGSISAVQWMIERRGKEEG
jgi:hypothetical protein